MQEGHTDKQAKNIHRTLKPQASKKGENKNTKDANIPKQEAALKKDHFPISFKTSQVPSLPNSPNDRQKKISQSLLEILYSFQES